MNSDNKLSWTAEKRFIVPPATTHTFQTQLTHSFQIFNSFLILIFRSKQGAFKHEISIIYYIGDSTQVKLAVARELWEKLYACQYLKSPYSRYRWDAVRKTKGKDSPAFQARWPRETQLSWVLKRRGGFKRSRNLENHQQQSSKFPKRAVQLSTPPNKSALKRNSTAIWDSLN